MALVDGAAYERAMALVGQLQQQAEIDTAALNRYKALTDDLADVLARMVGHCEPITSDDPVDPRERVLARYREARGR